MAPTPPFSPALLAGYGPLTFLGEDDTGSAWTAVQRESETPVVLRALTQLPGDEVERVLAAARALERLEHLGLARVRACGRDGEVPYLIAETVDGEPLRERLARARPTAEETLAAGEWLAEALAAAHGAGIVHGSVSPETIVAMGLGAVKLVDAGLRARGPEAYRSPEVCDGQPATPASEQYALGTVLYEMIAGCSPFDADGNVRPLADVVPGIDAGVAICLESALARDPKERFASMDEMREGLAIAHARLTGLPPMARMASKPLPCTDHLGVRRRGGGTRFADRRPSRYERIPFDPMPFAFALGLVLLVVIYQQVKAGGSVLFGGLRPADPPPARVAAPAKGGTAGAAPAAPAGGLGVVVAGGPTGRAGPARGLGGPTASPTVTAKPPSPPRPIAVVRAAQAFVPPLAATRRALVSTPDTSSTSPSTIQPSGRMRPRAGIKIPR